MYVAVAYTRKGLVANLEFAARAITCDSLRPLPFIRLALSASHIPASTRPFQAALSAAQQHPFLPVFPACTAVPYCLCLQAEMHSCYLQRTQAWGALVANQKGQETYLVGEATRGIGVNLEAISVQQSASILS